jgi:hypothetical protein
MGPHTIKREEGGFSFKKYSILKRSLAAPDLLA